MFKLSNDKGLSDVFLGQDKLPNVAHGWSSSLALITSGNLPPNPVELLGSEKMIHILVGLKDVADVIVIDSPPSIVSDAAVLSAKVDGVIMVVKPGHTRIDAAIAQYEQLNHAGARVVGVIFNHIPRKRNWYYGRYYYNYGQYYYSPTPKDDQFSTGDQPDDRTGDKRRFPGFTWLLAHLRG
jgi:capsular exopolysaccharide synthesis family protein